MQSPRICPCSGKIERKSFFVFIMILDLLTQGLGGLICGGIGLIVYCCTRNFNHFYFNIFSVGRLFIDIVIFIGIIVFLIRYLKNYDDLFRFLGIDSSIKAVFFFLILVVYYVWNIYLSYNFYLQIKYYQDEYIEGSESEDNTEEHSALKSETQNSENLL